MASNYALGKSGINRQLVSRNFRLPVPHEIVNITAIVEQKKGKNDQFVSSIVLVNGVDVGKLHAHGPIGDENYHRIVSSAVLYSVGYMNKSCDVPIDEYARSIGADYNEYVYQSKKTIKALKSETKRTRLFSVDKWEILVGHKEYGIIEKLITEHRDIISKTFYPEWKFIEGYSPEQIMFMVTKAESTRLSCFPGDLMDPLCAKARDLIKASGYSDDRTVRSFVFWVLCCFLKNMPDPVMNLHGSQLVVCFNPEGPEG